jgi:predicted DsbA family dithiol-disulfide isomerase
MPQPVKIAVISDVVCPWCYLGKRRLERALEETGIEAEVTWLPYELNPDMPAQGMPRADYRARKFGAERGAELDAQMRERGEDEGVTFAFDRMTRTPNTRRAHALIAKAGEMGLANAMAEELFRAYFEEGADVGDTATLVSAATGVGMDEATARAILDDEAIHREVAALEARAAQMGVSGVPFFIIDEKFAVSGAQPAESWKQVLLDIANGTEASGA